LLGGLVAAGFLIVPACSGDAPASEEEACQRFAEKACARARCCNAEGFDVLWGDDPTCIEGEGRHCRRILGANGVGDTIDSVMACAREIEPTACAQLPASCRSRGTLEARSPCAVDDQCKSATCIPNSEFCGICAMSLEAPEASSLPRRARDVDRAATANASCLTPAAPLPGDGKPCLQGQCNGSAACGSDDKCHRRARAGEPCGAGCILPAVCLTDPATMKSSCQVFDPNFCK
jgi:hypothetical protein